MLKGDNWLIQLISDVIGSADKQIRGRTLSRIFFKNDFYENYEF